MQSEKIYRIWPDDVYDTFLTPLDEPTPPQIWLLNHGPLLDRWMEQEFVRDPGRKKRLRPDLTTTSLAVPCVRGRVADSLLRDRRGIELLPARIEGEEWFLVHTLKSIDGVDLKSSGFWTVPLEDGELRHFNWVNLVRPDPLPCEFFHLLESPAGQPFVAEAFVERCRNLEVKGMKFELVGHVIPDPSEAVPPPPPNPKKASKVRKTKPLTLHTLPRDEAAEVNRHLGAWLAMHGLPPDAGSDAVLAAFGAQVEAARPGNSERSDDDWIALLSGLGAAYGDLVCRKLGWHWAELRMGRDMSWVVVASPAQTHALAPTPFVRGQLHAPVSTHTLLFNMLQAGQLPPAQPGTVVPVG